MKGLRSLLAFAETAKRGGFAAAGRALGCTPSTVAKSVGRLEIPLGLGIAQVPDYMAQDELAAGRLVGVLDLDSPRLARFDGDDARGLEAIVAAFVECTDLP